MKLRFSRRFIYMTLQVCIFMAFIITLSIAVLMSLYVWYGDKTMATDYLLFHAHEAPANYDAQRDLYVFDASFYVAEFKKDKDGHLNRSFGINFHLKLRNVIQSASILLLMMLLEVYGFFRLRRARMTLTGAAKQQPIETGG